MIFYVYMHNKVDRQDDEVIKFRAKDGNEARKLASQWNDCRSCRFTVGKAYRANEFKKRHRDWYDLISGSKPR